jgi:hypothetical protein
MRVVEEKRNVYKYWYENRQARDHLVGLAVNGRILLKRILKNMPGVD